MAYEKPDTEKPKEEAEEDPRAKVTYWLKWLKAAKENRKAKRHRDETRRAWNEYEKEANLDPSSRSAEVERCYPIYWAACKTLEPAYRARTPKLTADRRFGVNDVVSMTGSTIAERLGAALIEGCSYDEVITKAVADFIHGDKATVQVVYEADVKTIDNRKPLSAAEDGQYYDGDGMPYEGDVMQDGEGYFYNEQLQEADNQRIYVAPCIYDEILHTPTAKCQSEIEEKAFYFCMSKDKALVQFPELQGKSVSWKKGKASDDEEEDDKDASEMPGEYLDGFEIWCKYSKTTYWVSPSCYPADFLKTPASDPYELRHFFPSPDFIIGSPPAKHLYPAPAFVHLAEFIEQLHRCYGRVFNLINSIRRRALVDGTAPEVLAAFEDLGENEFITVQNLNALVEKGGIQNLIWYLPVQELVTAITELTALEQQFNQKFNEFFGVPDILRGISDPLTTAAAEQIATNAAHDRFRYQKQLIQKLERDTIEMMVDLALKVYSDEKIARITGYSYMTPEEQQAFPEALAMLRNDEERLIRLDIETDSTSFVNDAQENQKRNQIVQTLIQGMKEITGMLQVSPQYAAISLHAVMHTLDGLTGGKEFLNELKGHTDELIEQAMNPPQNEPPPDYEMLKIQVSQQAQQAKMFELQIKQQESQAEIQKNNFELSQSQQKQQFEQWLQSQYLRLQEAEGQIEQMKVMLSEREKMIEEQRLAQEQMQPIVDREPPAAEPSTNVIINVGKEPEPPAILPLPLL